ncbi:hypothetical protein NQ318_004039 [Aromia moschata]|uniref:Uncharacterized protein n=1 Tax=Aromia moschata TaxID=1265417 RepID=A0AAV8ZAX0_9CUCU|nr:hypothetical protein NQ318_004039 [Aromia moschata]
MEKYDSKLNISTRNTSNFCTHTYLMDWTPTFYSTDMDINSIPIIKKIVDQRLEIDLNVNIKMAKFKTQSSFISTKNGNLAAKANINLNDFCNYRIRGIYQGAGDYRIDSKDISGLSDETNLQGDQWLGCSLSGCIQLPRKKRQFEMRLNIQRDHQFRRQPMSGSRQPFHDTIDIQGDQRPLRMPPTSWEVSDHLEDDVRPGRSAAFSGRSHHSRKLTVTSGLAQRPGSSTAPSECHQRRGKSATT